MVTSIDRVAAPLGDDRARPGLLAHHRAADRRECRPQAWRIPAKARAHLIAGGYEQHTAVARVPDAVGHLGNQPEHVELLARQRDEPGVELRNLAQLADERHDARARLLGFVDHPAVTLAQRLDAFTLQHVEVASDHVGRRAQLVNGERQELRTGVGGRSDHCGNPAVERSTRRTRELQISDCRFQIGANAPPAVSSLQSAAWTLQLEMSRLYDGPLPMTSVSIVLPVYKDTEALARTLQALTTGTDADSPELIVVSTAEDATSLAPLRAAYGGVQWLETGQGRARQMNAGAARASGR